MIFSIEESIQKLKIEILSQDWSLSQKKIEPLEAAFTCLKNRFKTRKNAHAILTMADSVLQFAKKREAPLPPEFIDFLKETMAHVVNMYEESKFDPERDEDLFKRVYAKFNKLKEKVREEKNGGDASASLRPPDESAQAGVTKSANDPLRHEREAVSPPPSAPARKTPAPTKAAPESKTFLPQTGARVHKVSIGDLSIGVLAEDIALLKPLKPKKRKNYIKNSQIPLKDLGGIFRSLSGQLQGSLATLKESRLKKLVLPLVIPRGMGLPAIPDEEAAALLVLSHAQWHGVILCRHAEENARELVSFAKAKNGDIAGIAKIAGETELPLLNAYQMLEREGFLSVPD
ncbi:hypothetical protein ACUUL3_12310 [Thiovibrio sp. JS02]